MSVFYCLVERKYTGNSHGKFQSIYHLQSFHENLKETNMKNLEISFPASYQFRLIIYAKIFHQSENVDKGKERMVKACLFCICIFLAALIGIFTLICYQFRAPIDNLINGFAKDIDGNVNESMDTSDGNEGLNITNHLRVAWYDFACTASDSVSSDDDVEKSMLRSNAILMRSHGSFKLQLQYRKRIDDLSFCKFLKIDIKKINALTQFLKDDMQKAAQVGIAVLKIDSGGGNMIRLQGMSILASKIAIVDIGEISKPSKTLIHELGHSWSLHHPFDLVDPRIQDVPSVCMDGDSRAYQLANCPQSLRTCAASSSDEMLENVMDYLPEHCGRKYKFTKDQIAVIESNFSF